MFGTASRKKRPDLIDSLAAVPGAHAPTHLASVAAHMILRITRGSKPSSASLMLGDHQFFTTNRDRYSTPTIKLGARMSAISQHRKTFAFRMAVIGLPNIR